ncbi:protein-L-isoaspartate O-methyltransferase Pcm [Cupriavidus basilensis OR16]|uniref:Protein-L-isoaspartate O-methyltransferase Pcm n=1 Tax=Cupriavidus basilensis OR16 TaxID=1127483 RepID=H1SBH9_9BURK|nr:protein-L-isoaspartate O-methyltransferase [Cupriavidus basilensis]EHP40147.1 protein-L-isoaspartate O-methyltransferase Pcm [Cupriavidus basilensis OR16]
MDLEKARFNMIEQQIRPWDVLDQEILDLLAVVKREQFVPQAYAALAFVDMETEGNAATGWAASAPYDVICISGALPCVPASILSQVKVGGRIAAIVGALPAMEAQLITRVSETEYKTVNLFETAITPLIGAEQPSRFQF